MTDYKLALLVELLQLATHGQKQPIEKGYREDVIQRIPDVEKALAELKRYLDSN